LAPSKYRLIQIKAIVTYLGSKALKSDGVTPFIMSAKLVAAAGAIVDHAGGGGGGGGGGDG